MQLALFAQTSLRELFPFKMKRSALQIRMLVAGIGYKEKISTTLEKSALQLSTSNSIKHCSLVYQGK